MELQKFVTDIIRQMGGVVMPLEYALCDVLLPDEYSDLFAGKTEVTLAFDIDVAQENPQAEFVTCGSYLLDRMLEIVKKKPVFIMRHVVLDRVFINHPEEAILKYLNTDRAEIKINEERTVTGIWPVFIFSIQYVSDEKMSEVFPVWIHPVTGEYEKQMESIRLFYEDKPLYYYPVIRSNAFRNAFESAYQVVSQVATEKAKEQTDIRMIKNEIQRIEYYYEDLKEENQKLMDRKGISEERYSTLLEKHKAFDMEKERQARQIQEKYTVKTEISLDHSFTYFIPMVEYTVNIKLNGKTSTKLLYYNPVLRKFSSKDF
ncbi:MAG TPA: hypothetical protein DDZ89_19820 [Clostridiales bacterium]|nr:hypothetical protein [Clostridiales bacterium]